MRKSIRDGENWRGQPAYEELRKEIDVVGGEFLTALSGLGKGLYRGAQEDRPYFDLEALKTVKYTGRKRLETPEHEW